MSLPRIENADVRDRTVLVRIDLSRAFDSAGNMLSDVSELGRFKATLDLLLSRGASVVLTAHAGRPVRGAAKPNLKPIAAEFAKLLGRECVFSPVPENGSLDDLPDAPVVLLENLSKHAGEAGKTDAFAKRLAGLAHLYVNEAPEIADQAYATQSLLPRLLPSYAGIELNREVDAIEDLLAGKRAPVTAILGGVNLERKLALIVKLLSGRHVKQVLIGGGLSYTFMKSRAVPIGASLFEANLQVNAFQVIERSELSEVVLQLPQDHVVAERFEAGAKTKTVARMGIPEAWTGLDIGPKTVSLYQKAMKKAGAVFWYGPMGAVELEGCRAGTLGLARAITKGKAFSVVAGESLTDCVGDMSFSHVCRNSALALGMIMGTDLPGLDALRKGK